MVLAKATGFQFKRVVPDFIAVILLGIIEGITEFIPVSSTGHLLMAEQWLPRQSDLFNIVIQSAAVVAVIPLFRVRLQQAFTGWREPAVRDWLLKVAVAFGITGVGGVILDKLKFKLPEEIAPVAWALFLGGILFVVVEKWLAGKSAADLVTWPVAVAIGAGQLVAAVFPGASRSGTTILVALVLGLNRPAATEFSFLVGIPTMIAAGGLKIFKAWQHGAPAENWGMVALGSVVSAVVSFLAVKWLLCYVQTHTFEWFGWYRIALGLALLSFALAQ